MNHKKVERLYREEGLTVRRRRRKRVARPRVELPTTERANEQRSMDFMRDQLAGGRVFRLQTIVDHYTRESLAIAIDLSLPGTRVAQVLDRLRAHRGWRRSICVDNGPEFTRRALDEWAHLRGVKLEIIRPGKPVENAFIESFNGRLRQECLNQHWFSRPQGRAGDNRGLVHQLQHGPAAQRPWRDHTSGVREDEEAGESDQTVSLERDLIWGKRQLDVALVGIE